MPLNQPIGVQRKNVVFIFNLPHFIEQTPKLTKYAGNYFAMGFDNDHGEFEWKPGQAKQYDSWEGLIEESGIKYVDNTKIPTLGEVCVESEIISGPCDYESFVDGGVMTEWGTLPLRRWSAALGIWIKDESKTELDQWIETYGEHVKAGWDWANDTGAEQCLSCNGFKFIEESESEGYHTIVDPSQLLPIPNARDLNPDGSLGDHQHAPDGVRGYGQIAWDTEADPFTHDGYGPLDENGWTKWTVYEPDKDVMQTSLRVPAFMIQFNLNHPGTIQLTTGSCEGAEIDGDATNVDTYMCLSRIEDGLSIAEDGDSCAEGGNNLNSFIEAHLEAKSYICGDSSDGIWDEYGNPYLFKFGYNAAAGPFSSACNAYNVLITGQTKEDRGSFKFAYRFKPDPENLCIDEASGVTRYTDDPTWYTGGDGVCNFPTPTPTTTTTPTQTPSIVCVDYYGNTCFKGDLDCICLDTPTPITTPTQNTPTPTPSINTPTPTPSINTPTPSTTPTSSLNTPTPTLSSTPTSSSTPTVTQTPTPTPSVNTPSMNTQTPSINTPSLTPSATPTWHAQELWKAYSCSDATYYIVNNTTGYNLFEEGSIVCTTVGCVMLETYDSESAFGTFDATIIENYVFSDCPYCMENSIACAGGVDVWYGGQGEPTLMPGIVNNTPVWITPTPSATPTISST